MKKNVRLFAYLRPVMPIAIIGGLRNYRRKYPESFIFFPLSPAGCPPPPTSAHVQLSWASMRKH